MHSGPGYIRRVTGAFETRKQELAARLEPLRHRCEELPGAPLALGTLRRERELAGELLAGGIAFRMFLWLVPFGFVVACVLSFWGKHDSDGLESAARRFGITAAAARGASAALQASDGSIVVAFLLGLVAVLWTALRVVRAISLAYALAWELEPPRIHRPVAAILAFNGLALLASFGAASEQWVREEIGLVALLLGTAIAFGITTGVALVAMSLLPGRATRPRELLPGALLVATGHQALQLAVLVYFAPKLGAGGETYGVFGAAAVLLLWVYLVCRLVVAAAFLNASVWSDRTSTGTGSA